MNIKQTIFLLLAMVPLSRIISQTPAEIIEKVKAKLSKVDDYQANGKMKTNVLFIKAPVANVKVYYKKPDKLRIDNEKGISFIPKGSVNINLNNLFLNTNGFDLLDLGHDSLSHFRVIKLVPKDENSDVVLSTIFIDEAQSLIRKASTTTRENGTYELEMTYGKYAAYGLADKVMFTFNTRDYKLPKGITFDYDDGSTKETLAEKEKNRKGRVEIVYSGYIINKGVSDAVFK